MRTGISLLPSRCRISEPSELYSCDPSHLVSSHAFPPKLMLFSSGDDAEVRMWDLVDKTCTATFKVWAIGVGEPRLAA